MELPSIIDQIEEMVIGRKEPSEIRPQILRLRDVSEAIENDLATTKAELQKRSLDAEKATLKEECYRLELNLIEAKQEIEALKAKIAELEAAKGNEGKSAELMQLQSDYLRIRTALEDKIEEVTDLKARLNPPRKLAKEEEVLAYLKPREVRTFDLMAVAFGCSTSEDKAHAILQRLENDGLAATWRTPKGYAWCRTIEGGEYLYRNNLLTDETPF